MKQHRSLSVLLGISLAASLPFSLHAGSKEDGHSHSSSTPAKKAEAGHGHSHDASGGHSQQGHDHGNFKTPGTVQEAWAMLNANLADCKKLAEEKKWDELHKQANALPVAIKVLVEKSSVIEDDGKRKRAEGALKQLEKAAGDLHHASEDKDAEATKKAFEKANKLIELIKSQYPADVIASAAVTATMS